MSQAAQSPSSPAVELDAAGVADAIRRELRDWAWLAVGALAVAGVFAHSARAVADPGNGEGAVLADRILLQGPRHPRHVLAGDLASRRVRFPRRRRDASASAAKTCAPRRSGGSARALVLVAFPCLFAPAFLDATQPELTNYIPLIRHPAYDLGLVSAGARRARAGRCASSSICRADGRPRSPRLTLAMALAGFIYVWRWSCFAHRGALLAARGRARVPHASCCSGAAGICCSSSSAIVLVTNWSILARRSLGEKAVNNGVFRRRRSASSARSRFRRRCSTRPLPRSRTSSMRRSASCNSASCCRR